MEGSSGAILTANDVVSIRTMLGLTTREFASVLNVNIKTIERWEKGESIPSGATASLLDLIRRYPETIDKLKIDNMPFDLRLKIYKNARTPMLVCVIDVDEIERIVNVKNYTSSIEDLPFGENLTPGYKDYDEFIRGLCSLNKGRGMLLNPIDELINTGGNKNYKVIVSEKLESGIIKEYIGGSKRDSRRKNK